MSSRRSQHVAVVGAGIAGLAAAIAIGRAGHEVRVFERRNDPRLGRGAMLLWPDALAVLDALGVGAAVRRCARTIERVELGSMRGQSLASWAVSGPLRVIERSALLELLLAEIPPDALQLGRTVASCARDGHGVVLRAADDAPLDRAELLVACDGPRSRIREQLFGGSDEQRVGRLAWRAVALHDDTDAVPEGVVLGTLGEAQSFCAVRLDRMRVQWYATRTGSHGPLDVDTLAQAFAGWPRHAAELVRRTHEPVAALPIGESPASPHWQRGRVVLLGEAARGPASELSGAAGDALESAVLLGALLATHGADEHALHGYARARHTRAAALMRTGRVVGRWSLRQTLDAVGLRELVLARLLPTLGHPSIASAPHLDAARALRDAGAIAAASIGW